MRLSASNENYTTSKYWRVSVTDQKVPKIMDVYPAKDVLIMEGSQQNFRINISVPDGISDSSVSWYLNGDKVADDVLSHSITPSGLGDTYTQIDTLMVEVISGSNKVSHTWQVGIYFLKDTDGDGYTDTDEQAIGTDPLDFASIPLDTDGDGIPDVNDLDDDGDGVLDSKDSAPENPEVQTDAADGTLMIVILELVAIVVFALLLILLGRKRA